MNRLDHDVFDMHGNLLGRIVVPEPAPRHGEWTRHPSPIGSKGARYVLEGTGYQVQHCGHPTANWPYYGITPDGRDIFTHNGKGFRLLEEAKAAIEALARGESPRVHIFARGT